MILFNKRITKARTSLQVPLLFAHPKDRVSCVEAQIIFYLFSNRMVVIKVGNHKIIVSLAIFELVLHSLTL